MNNNEERAQWLESEAGGLEEIQNQDWRLMETAKRFRECAQALRSAESAREALILVEREAKILEQALRNAAYALFQIKRMVGVTDAIKEHSIKATEAANEVLNECALGTNKPKADSLLRPAATIIVSENPEPYRPNKPMDFRSYEKTVTTREAEPVKPEGETPKQYDTFVSDEPLEIIRYNECEDGEMGLRLKRFRRFWNEIVRLNAALQSRGKGKEK